MVDKFIWEDERTIGGSLPIPILDIPCGTVVPKPDTFEAFVIKLVQLLCDSCKLAEEERLLEKTFPGAY